MRRIKNKSNRPLIFKKPTIFFSARVHPGEVAASHVLNGILRILTDPDNVHGKILRKHFVFKIIPLLNPDGVYRGYFRHDTKGNNLNRFYNEPKIDLHPTIYAAKKIIQQQKELGKMQIYIDLHAHAWRKGCFMFGNSLPLETQKIDNMLLPKVISLNSPDFDFNQWSFAEVNMKVKDKNSGLSREGWGRVSVWKDTGINNSYTLEWHYAVGITKNQISNLVNIKTKVEIENQPEESKELQLAGTCREYPYTQESFENVGEAVCLGILDFYELNPISRIPSCKYATLDAIKEELKTQINEQRLRKAQDTNDAYNRLYNGGAKNKKLSKPIDTNNSEMISNTNKDESKGHKSVSLPRATMSGLKSRQIIYNEETDLSSKDLSSNSKFLSRVTKQFKPTFSHRPLLQRTQTTQPVGAMITGTQIKGTTDSTNTSLKSRPKGSNLYSRQVSKRKVTVKQAPTLIKKKSLK